MLFNLEQGPHAEAIIRQAILNRQPVPAKIANSPALLPWLDPIYIAFLRLHTCRVDGGSIPWTAVYQYAIAYSYLTGVDDTGEFDRFETLISKMDSAYIEFTNAKREKEMKAAKRPAKGKGKR